MWSMTFLRVLVILFGHTAYSINDSGKLGVNSWDLEALARIIKMRVMPRGVNELSIGSIKTALISLFRFRKNITDSKFHVFLPFCYLLPKRRVWV